MKYKELFGNSIKDDIDEIKKEIDEEPSIVFVYSGAGKTPGPVCTVPGAQLCFY